MPLLVLSDTARDATAVPSTHTYFELRRITTEFDSATACL